MRQLPLWLSWNKCRRRQWMSYFPLLLSCKHTLGFFLWSQPHRSTSQGHKTDIVVFIHDYCPAPLPVNATEMALSLHVFDFLSHWSIWRRAVLANNPFLTHLDRQGEKELPLRAWEYIKRVDKNILVLCRQLRKVKEQNVRLMTRSYQSEAAWPVVTRVSFFNMCKYYSWKCSKHSEE